MSIKKGRIKLVISCLLYPLIGWTGIPTLLAIEGIEEINKNVN